MNKKLLKEHIQSFLLDAKKDLDRINADFNERSEKIKYYKVFTKAKILSMDKDTVYEYLSDLWAMLIWGNKHYVVDKIINENGLDNFRNQLANLLWSSSEIEIRWDTFRKSIKGMGPAMISEILCKTHPDDYILWNRRAYVALNYLQVPDLPRYDYQLTGSVYKYLCGVAKTIAAELSQAGFKDSSLLSVDYFIWDELQVEDNLSKLHSKESDKPKKSKPVSTEESQFIHNDIRDKLSEIGQWLGFTTRTEQKVSEGSVVDTVWESTIGNMGRIIYVFEVQTKGSIDSLILNLLKSLNNPAVQGVVAVSDQAQLDKIRSHASAVKDLKDKLKYWDYEQILKVHESLAYVNESINNLDLVPKGF